MAEYVDTNGDPVPEVSLEAYIETAYQNVVHVRVTGFRWEFPRLLQRFTELCQQYQNRVKGYNSEL